MTLRYVRVALTAVVLSCGLPTVDPADAQTRDAGLMAPEKGGLITVAGCFQRGGQEDDGYVLANPTLGPMASVPEGTCKATIDDRALDLSRFTEEGTWEIVTFHGQKYTTRHGLNQSMLGHWVEISGRLEKESDADLTNLRELKVRSFRMLPVVLTSSR